MPFFYPGEYKGVFKRANELAREMMELATGRDSEGFILLRRKKELSEAEQIDDAICELQSFLSGYKPKAKALMSIQKKRRYLEIAEELEKYLNMLVKQQKAKYN